MTPFALLDASLLDLLYELRDTDIHLRRTTAGIMRWISTPSLP
jgi:hypothetical protein